MLNKYKNALFEKLLDRGFSNKDFIFNDDVNNNEVRIRYKDTLLEFRIVQSASSFHHFSCRFTIFHPHYPMTNYSPATGTEKFDSALALFERWLAKEVGGYLEDKATPNFWEQYIQDDAVFEIEKITFNDRTYFSSEEKEQINSAINELKLLIQESFSTTIEQQEIVVERLDYLSNALEKNNKFDWKGIVFSIIIDLAEWLILTDENKSTLLGLFKKAFGSVKAFLDS